MSAREARWFSATAHAVADHATEHGWTARSLRASAPVTEATEFTHPTQPNARLVLVGFGRDVRARVMQGGRELAVLDNVQAVLAILSDPARITDPEAR